MLLRSFLAALLLVVVPAARGEQVVTHPYRGVTLVDRTEIQPRAAHMHIVVVDLEDAGVHFKLSPARPVGGSETTGQTTLDYLVQEHAQLAVNVHFFGYPLRQDGGTDLVGFAASMGQVYSGFDERPALNYALMPNAPVLNIGVENQATIAVRGASAVDLLDAGSGLPVAPYNALAGSAQIITHGKVTIPEGLPPRPKTRPADPEVSWYHDQVAARTAVGLSRDGRTLVLFTVDGGEAGAGMTVAEMAEMLRRDYGVIEALNLDGGGSTTLAMANPGTGRAVVVNAVRGELRKVGSSLAIFAAPVEEVAPWMLGAVVLAVVYGATLARRR
jgi:hypothetical protein